jgi:hypothetical protein
VVSALVAVAALAGCSVFRGPAPTPTMVGCTLEPVNGVLAFEGGALVLLEAWSFHDLQDPLPVRWPLGWNVVSASDGASVFDDRGKLQGRSGTTVSIYAQSVTGSPLIDNGELVACPMDVFQGHWPPGS